MSRIMDGMASLQIFIVGVVEEKSYTVLTEHGTYSHILNPCAAPKPAPLQRISNTGDVFTWY